MSLLILMELVVKLVIVKGYQYKKKKHHWCQRSLESIIKVFLVPMSGEVAQRRAADLAKHEKHGKHAEDAYVG